MDQSTTHFPFTAAAGGGGAGMTRQQHMEAKRAFDRAKHHPSSVGDTHTEPQPRPFNSNSDRSKPQQHTPHPQGGDDDGDDLVEYRAADGSTKTMPRAQLEARLREQQEAGGLPQMGEDGSLTKQQEGKATVEEVG
jgi:hypothetical protein